MVNDIFRLCDDLGPTMIVHLQNHAAGLKAIVVVDNVAAGPAIGGSRMATDVSVEECVRLARAMTLKCAAAGLPHGGAKSVIFADPALPADQRETIIRAFACAMRDITDYVAGPDMGTDEEDMARIQDEIGRSVGLPRELGGIPLDEIGATGFGVAVAAEVAQEFCNISIKGARVVVQGFGAVGMHAAGFLVERGAVLVGASDSRGSTFHSDGIDIEALSALKREGRSVTAYPGGKRAGRDDAISTPCDIWIPAARPDIIREDNVDLLDCKMVLQGANIPVTEKAEERLHDRGVLCVPDFIANAGGVICAAIEYRGGTEAGAFASIEEKVRANTRAVLEAARRVGERPRPAAVKLARERLNRAVSFTRWGRSEL